MGWEETIRGTETAGTMLLKGWVSSRKKSPDSVIKPDKWVWELICLCQIRNLRASNIL